MKLHKMWGVRLTLFVVFCMIGTQIIGADLVLYVNNTQANVRSSPTTSAKNVIATIPAETPVVVLQQQGLWYQVRLPDGREGWISKRVLSARETAEGTTGRNLLQSLPQDESATAALTEPMILVPAGTYPIGSSEADLQHAIKQWNVARETLTDELDRQTVSLPAFWIDPYEVTNAQYKKFVDATRYPPPPHWVNGMYLPGAENNPVTFVSWDDASAYAQWAGKRLPTAEEWEAAARGKQGRLFPWGNIFDRQRVNVNQPHGAPAPAGSAQDDVSELKIHDLGGNVMEWTVTPYQNNREYFVVKGGAWLSRPVEARGANQTAGHVEFRGAHIGFRCAKSAARE